MIRPTGASASPLASIASPKLLWFAAIVAVCLVLATRAIPVMADDVNYLTYFRGIAVGRAPNVWAAILDEPVWRISTRVMGQVFGAELAMRIMLFLSPLVLLMSSRRLLGGVAWLFLAYFIIGDGISGGLYGTVIRQGLATSLFLGLAMAGLNPILAAIVAAGFHSSFLLVVATLIMVEMLADAKYRVLGVVLGLALAAALLFGSSQLRIALDDPGLLGRRAQTYRGLGGLNLGGYIGSLLHFAVALALACPPLQKLFEPRYRLYLYAIALTVMTYVAVLANVGFVRFFVTVSVIVTLALLTRIGTRRANLGIAFWMLGALALSIHQSLTDSPYSWWALWEAILTRR